MTKRIETITFGKHAGKLRCSVSYPTPGMNMHFSQCRNPAYDGDICKFHMAVENRKIVKVERERDIRKHLDKNRNDAQTSAQNLSERLGVPVQAHSFFPPRGFQSIYTGDMIVSVEFLETVARAKEEGDWH